MKRWRKVIGKIWYQTGWTLQLECGHEAFRTSPYSREELPAHVLCQSCNFLIGQQVKDRRGGHGKITGYKDGRFAVAWNSGGLTQSTLDQLREESEIV